MSDQWLRAGGSLWLDAMLYDRVERARSVVDETDPVQPSAFDQAGMVSDTSSLETGHELARPQPVFVPIAPIGIGADRRRPAKGQT